MATNSRFLLCFLILCLTTTCCYGNICLPRNHAALFVFGDSYFDVGNNNYFITPIQGIRKTYGETFFNYPNGRFSDGRVIPDFIPEYAKLPLTLPYLFPGNQRYIDGANFASAGAGAPVETHKGMVIDLKSQLAGFKSVSKKLRKELGDIEAKCFLSRSVYLFNMGANDYNMLAVEKRNAYSTNKFVDMVISNQTSVVKVSGNYCSLGGRKFGFLGVGPLGCHPLRRVFVNGSKDSYLEDVQIMPKQHNTALSVALKKLEWQLKGLKYSFTNFNELVLEVMFHPSKNDFKEGEVACYGSGPYRGQLSCGHGTLMKDYYLCDNPNEHVFFDYTHPTEKAAQVYAKQMWSGSTRFTGPYNLKKLFED
ncbi:hypothetical protein L6164_013185 [Bauhinia variegata]|uniref:Uncharacterized protein n=1 Tax=Bauhinia variegata TaxID=167791 RepID=A0ACB9PBJ8_BAUVA|nr:hypothetical protein L6164_013185 [Bauhinia variegata]